MTQQMPGASRPPSAAPNGGSITGQVQVTELGPNRTTVPGIRVYFRTAKGQDGSVFVPESQYTQDNALAQARAAANLIDALHNAAI